MYYIQYFYLSDIALDASYNHIYPPFKSTTRSINEWIKQIIPICNNSITNDIYNFLHNIQLSYHNIKSILHLFNKGLIYRNEEHNICGIILWTIKLDKLNVIYSYANTIELYNTILQDIEEYSSTISISQINILWNTSHNFNIYNEINDIKQFTLYTLCLQRGYSIVSNMFQKKIDSVNRFYNIDQYRYIHRELLK
jgi:hypothetical protein